MRKLFSISITIIIAALLVVACSPEGNKVENKTAVVSFSTGDNLTRSLSRVNPEFKSADYYWTYTATKTDGTGLNTGATTAEVAVKSDKGLASVGPFSYGTWSFTLNGYVDQSHTKLAYKGTSDATISDSSTIISITVTVQNSDNGEGYLELPAKGSIAITGTSVTPNYNNLVEVINIKPLDTNGRTEQTVYDKAADEDATSGERTFTLKSGNYAVTVSYLEGATKGGDKDTYTGGYTVASDTIYVTILDYLTTKIGGDVAENTGSVEFGVADGTVRAVSEVKTLNSGDSATTEISVAASPATTTETTSGSEEVRKTTISIPSGLVESATSAKVSVTSYTQEAASKEKATFEIESSSQNSTATVLGGLDIDLYLNNSDEKTKSFAEDKVLTITTVIAKGLDKDDIVVKYNGEDLDDGTVTSYNSSTGELTFTVNHLSSFYIGSKSAVVYDSTTQTAYKTLANAFKGAKSGDTLILLKNIESLTETISVDKSITLDLNGYSIKATNRVFFIHNGTLTVDNGTIEANVSDVNSSVIRVSCTDNCTATESLGLVLKSGVTVNATNSYGVTAFGYKDATLDIYGTIVSKNACIGGNGTNTLTGKITVNVYDSAKLTAEGDINTYKDASAIYQPNVGGVLNIYGGDITSSNFSAVEIRNGIATIKGGTLSSNASSFNETYKTSGDGPATSGAALAINYYGTGVDTAKNGITVSIEGGTFKGQKHLAFANSEKLSVDNTKLVKAVVKSGVRLDTVVGYTADKTGDKTYYLDKESAFENGVEGDVRVGATVYPTIQKAFEYIKTNQVKDVTIEILAEEVNLEKSIKDLLGAESTSGYTITFVGKGKDHTAININTGKKETGEQASKVGANYVDGAKLSFQNLTVIMGDDSDYQGFVRSSGLSFTNCSFVGKGCIWGSGKVEFYNCVFEDWNANKTEEEIKKSYFYNLWLNTVAEYSFEKCTFNSSCGRFINAYLETGTAATTTVNVTIKDCIFNGKEGIAKKSALILKNNTTWIVSLNKITTNNVKTADAKYGGSSWYEIDDSGTCQNGTNVTVNDVVVWQNGSKVTTD